MLCFVKVMLSCILESTTILNFYQSWNWAPWFSVYHCFQTSVQCNERTAWSIIILKDKLVLRIPKSLPVDDRIVELCETMYPQWYLPRRHVLPGIRYMRTSSLTRCFCFVYKIGTDDVPLTHICVIKLTIIGSDNDLSPGRCQAIIWTSAGILLIGFSGTNWNEILIERFIYFHSN